MNRYPLARDEVELINPKTTRETFELLRTYHSAEWFDERGKWHVVITRAALELVEQAANNQEDEHE